MGEYHCNPTETPQKASTLSITLPIFTPDSPTERPPAAPAQARESLGLIDSHGRTIHDLRLSVTDRCNYRCIYCMDPDFRYMPKQSLLTLDEYLRVVRVATSLGIRKLRVTGGEPTLYPHLDQLLAELGSMPLDDVALTTNGSLVTAKRAQQWAAAGLRRITFSLDSLQTERVQTITRTNTSADTVIEAIRHAQAAGLGPIKVNAVVMSGVNDDEVADFADFAREHDIDFRMIEFMPLDSSRAWDRTQVVTADEMLQRITGRHALKPIKHDDPHSTSLNFTFADGAPGRVGIIAPVSRPFCGACSRLRITADGKIRPCLFSTDEWDLRPLLRANASDAELSAFFINAVWTKQKGHGIGSSEFQQPTRTMSAIGG